MGAPPAGGAPRNSPSHASISRSSRGAGGAERWGQWALWVAAAAALGTTWRTPFLAIDSGVVCGSSGGVRRVGIRVVPAPDGALARGGAADRVVAPGRPEPSTAGCVG